MNHTFESEEAYQRFLEQKIKVAGRVGIQATPDVLHHSTKPHQSDIIIWALELGAALIAADTGMGKTHIGIETLRIIQQNFGGKCLIVTELGASETFVNEDPEVGEGARLGVKLEYVTNQAEAFESACDIVVTNYERVRADKFDFGSFTGVWLDEGNYLKNMASETTDSLQRQLSKVKFKYVATATPSPNETIELINYAHCLGICDRGQILTRFFQRNSTKAGDLTLHENHVEDFWLWVYSWAVFIQRPSDLGYSDEGYDLPDLNVEFIEVKTSVKLEGKVNRDGQKEMYVEASSSLPEAHKIKTETINERLEAAMEVFSSNADVHWIIWHHREEERKAINKKFKDHDSYADVFGNLHWKEKERRIVAFTKGELKVLATKPDINGVGCNFQKHCYNNILLGVNHSFDEFYQLIKRTHRYPQTQAVNAYVFFTPEEHGIVQNLKRKWKEHNETRAKMREIVLKYGLNQRAAIEERRRSFHIERDEINGKDFTFINNDCVYEFKRLPDNSLDMIITSIPFGNHYEYTDKYNDFGHNMSNEEFFKQMDFLVPELLRTLKPGRIAAIHTKNRIHYGSVTGLGFSTFHRFTHKTCDCFEKNGFHTMGFHYIPTDVVAENNQTYRLGYGEMQKDATKMGSGIPEEIWLFRKAPTSNENAYADVPVTKNMVRCPYCAHEEVPKEFERKGSPLAYCKGCKQFLQFNELQSAFNDPEYTLAHWQIDADSFWKSSGNRYLMPHELKTFGIDKLQAWWKKFNSEIVYDYDGHVKLLQSLEDTLSKTFTTLPLRSNSDFIWNDVNRMHGLNMEQSRRKKQNHICPMPFDEVDRLIFLYTNEGDKIGEPFAGLGTTGVRAIKHRRKAFLTELSKLYFQCGGMYLKEAEYKRNIPTLFDTAS
jgi:DNA modification methylase